MGRQTEGRTDGIATSQYRALQSCAVLTREKNRWTWIVGRYALKLLNFNVLTYTELVTDTCQRFTDFILIVLQLETETFSPYFTTNGHACC